MSSQPLTSLRPNSEFGGYEVNFSVNPLIHLALLMFWYGTKCKTHFGIS